MNMLVLLLLYSLSVIFIFVLLFRYVGAVKYDLKCDIFVILTLDVLVGSFLSTDFLFGCA